MQTIQTAKIVPPATRAGKSWRMVEAVAVKVAIANMTVTTWSMLVLVAALTLAAIVGVSAARIAERIRLHQ